PLAWNDLGRADLQGLVAYAAVPWVLSRLARATGVEPFAGPPPGAAHVASGRSAAAKAAGAEALGLGVVLAVAGSFVPAIVVETLAASLALVLAGLLFDRPGPALRSLAVTAGGVLVAFVLAFPWSLTLLQPGARWSVLVGATPSRRGAPDLASILRLALGPVGGGALGWGLLAAGAFVLLVGRGPRFAWGARLWVVGLAAVVLAWAGRSGWIGSGGGATRVLVAPLAACVAALAGLGVAAVAQDLRRSGFGWRHAGAVLFGAAVLAGALPVVAATPGGRWGLASTGYDTVLSWVGGPRLGGPSERVLWLGSPRALPLVGWQVERGLAAGVSAEGLPDATRLWPSVDPGAASSVLADVRAAQAGLTIRLGHLVAPQGIRYIVVPSAVAPVLPGVQSATLAPAPQDLLDGLAAQSDLHELPSEGGIVVFENDAWSARAVVRAARSGGVPAPLRSAGVALALAGWLALAVFYARRRRARHVRRHDSGRFARSTQRAHARARAVRAREVRGGRRAGAPTGSPELLPETPLDRAGAPG
ncbi:MAG: hypothetical protein M0Z33_02485, partial [Actinomycetota bacterium]|nr:hypothetical protein [Actinomycetota bacterium]